MIIAFDQGQIKVHTKINVRVTYLNEQGEMVTEVVKTSTGRVLFNEIVPTEMGFINKTLGKKELRILIGEIHARVGTAKAATFLDDMKRIGYENATLGGLSFSLEDHYSRRKS